MEPCLENVKSSRKSKEEKKLLRKQIKASHVLLKHEGISTVSQPTQSLVVANGGLGNGVSREQLLAVLKEGGEVETLVMPPHKPYALVTYRSQDCAQRAHALLNSRQLCCGDHSVALYLSFIDSVVSEREACVSLPPGLLVAEDYVTPEEEAVLLDAIDWSSHDDDVTAQKALKHRRVKHYGYEFRYDNNNVDKDKPLPGGLPQPCVSVLERCMNDGHVSSMPDQLTVNQYQSGQGIPPHVDTHSAFEDSILSLSLGAKTVMEFRHPDGRQVAVVLPGRSLLVMKGESRSLWTHGITPRKFDVVPACDPQSRAAVTSDLSNHGNLTLSKRGTRTSLTFRKIRFTPCDCAFPSACDSQRPAPASPPSLPRCPSEAARLEEQYVHRVYDSIAAHFSGTRHSPWPRVCHFLAALPPGSLVADVGCGNGKYLGVNPDVITVGCDHSSVLVQICLERGHLAFVSDALSVPLRSEIYDACISIAVIHHFSTQERRLAAVRELTRLLKPGGRALIYVWALEQEHNKQRSKYLREPQGPSGTASDASVVDSIQETGRPTGNGQLYKEHPAGTEDTSVQVSPGKESSTKLSVHTNRTAFNSQDLLVPWHLKAGGEERRRKEGEKGEGGGGGGPRNTPEPCSNADLHTSVSSPDPSPKTGPVFHRFYHVFQQGELEGLCGRVRGVRVESSYHDQGNWCVILEKTTGDCL
ncbi:alkylated DNA repair protein alkB homolog 8 isoform X1 [Osmerus mordax]|uniref:alkylated DNA repair protein alkB homolog 8 isoform X1 n=2 Tax=Osmerus mordax TaxID=8014 RepID=UPI003510712F